MAGVTVHEIHYPDGASKAKNLGPELKRMAEDIDRVLTDLDGPLRPIIDQIADSAVDDRVAGLNVVTGVPETDLPRTSRTDLPIAWTHRVINDPWTDVYTDVETASYNGSTRYTGDVPILRDGKLLSTQIPDDIARKADIPAPLPTPPSIAERVVRPEVPILGARVAAARVAGTAVSVVFAGSSTSAARPGYVARLTEIIQSTYPVDDPTATQWSSSADFIALNAAGIHGYSAGESSTTSGNYLTDAECNKIALLRPALILHMIGSSNDYTNQANPANVQANIASRLAYLDSVLVEPCQHVLVHTYARMEYTPATYPHAAYGDAIAAVAASRADTHFIDISGAYRAAGVPAGGDPLDLISTDHLHQTPAGYRFMTDLLSSHLVA